MATQDQKEKEVAQETPVLRVPSVSRVSKENQVLQARRERSELRGKRV